MINQNQQWFVLLQNQNGAFKSKISANTSKNLVLSFISCKPSKYPTAFHNFKSFAEGSPGSTAAIAALKEQQDTGGQSLEC